MILEMYKYDLDESYIKFKDTIIDLLYNVENDDDVTHNDIKLFHTYVDQLKVDFAKT